MSREALELTITGVVQGVGFRPFVYCEAKKFHLTGWVLNTVTGVVVHAEGEADALDKFTLTLSNDAPAAAQVREIAIAEVPLEGFESFEIRFSEGSDREETTLVSPDLATCDECVAELFDPHNRRYHYPFINCTNCGPRFTIMEGLPYDRAKTSMKAFTMCPACQAEYDDPANRRFHAQPDACFECGPAVGWVQSRKTEEDGCDAVCAAGVDNASDQTAQRPGAAAQSTANATVTSDMVGAADMAKTISWAHTRQESDALFVKAATLIAQGGIVAVKGLGGYHLVCDANNEQAIAKLRRRKRREGKAFAVMVASVEAAQKYCSVNDAECRQLQSPARPIVLLQKMPGAELAPGLADALPELGVMLPTTPVQHLLLHACAAVMANDGSKTALSSTESDVTKSNTVSTAAQTAEMNAGTVGSAEPSNEQLNQVMLVMTSGNIHDEPIVTDEKTAFDRLGSVADAFLVNNRAIVGRYDDSVLRVLDAGAAGEVIQFIRRARGFAPLPITINTQKQSAADFTHHSELLAVGPEQKSTFTFTRDAKAFVSQHIGDMESVPVMDAWNETRKRYEELFRLHPQCLVCDYHPEYLTSKWAHKQASATGMPLVQVQHHHAHILSVMGENGIEGPVAGFAFDGTGYGLDGAIWGGEVLLSNLKAYERFANFAYIPLPGGAAAIKNPARIAYGALWAFDLLDHPAAQAFVKDQVSDAEVLGQMIDRGLNTPETSSVGRLFDAASALLGICTHPRYEGEAAILLEAALHDGIAHPEKAQSDVNHSGNYRFELIKNVATETSTAADTSVLLIDAAPVFKALLDDLSEGVPVALIARWFHDAFVQIIVDMAEIIRATYDIAVVVLAGGVFMNRYLMQQSIQMLMARGFTVALNRDLPPNDASISYGQAVIGLQTQTKE